MGVTTIQRRALNEVSGALAAGKGRVAALLGAEGSCASNPCESLERSRLVVISHEGTSLLESTNAAFIDTSIATGSGRLPDHSTALSNRHGGSDRGHCRSCPGPGVVDTQTALKLVLDEAYVESTANGNGVGDTESLCNGDGHRNSSAHDGGHLHIPVDEGLSRVRDKSSVVAVLALGKGHMLEGVGRRGEVEPFMVDLRWGKGDTGCHKLGFPFFVGQVGSYS